MFSGIVAGQGILRDIDRKSSKQICLKIQHSGLCSGVKIGESVAVNGCCLTVISNRQGILEFNLLEETLKRTSLNRVKPPLRVNLETALRFGNPVGGHLLTGHIDGVGRIVKRFSKKADIFLEIEPAMDFLQWVVLKGSVAVDGVSLTVATVGRKSFGIWLIPHTLKLTTLGWKKENDHVNLEGDMLAKYVQKALALTESKKK